MKTQRPIIKSDFKRIIQYSGNHLQDFCLFKALDQTWHAFGIFGNGSIESEISFFHNSSSSLYGEYKKHNLILTNTETGNTQNRAPHKYAPFVMEKDGVYFLFYTRPNGTNMYVKSPDLYEWSNKPEIIFEQGNARDMCIQKIQDFYYCYYCDTYVSNGKKCGAVFLRKSKDLERWGASILVHNSNVEDMLIESPFVIEHENIFYLFVCNRTVERKRKQCVNYIYCSESPESFKSGFENYNFEMKDVFAVEIVKKQDEFHIAKVSGKYDRVAYAPPQGGWIDIAELTFARQV